jgi:hypothetical protein
MRSVGISDTTSAASRCHSGALSAWLAATLIE